MVPSPQRLPLRQDVTFFKRAERISTPYFLVYWEKNAAVTQPQVSIIVPKHQVRTSVKRHKIKRQIKAIVSDPEVTARLSTPSLTIVVVANQHLLKISFQNLTAELVRALGSIK